MSVLFKADEATKLNDTVKNEISSNLFIFCNYEPTPKITNDPGGLFLLEISNFYKLLVDSGWVIKKFAYIYSGKERSYASHLPFAQQDIDKIFFMLKNLRTGFFHNVSHNNGDDIIINIIKAWFSLHKSNSIAIDYTNCIKNIDDDAKIVIEICKHFIDCVKKMPNAEREAAIERWKSVIIDYYKEKRDIFINMVGSYYLFKNAQPSPKKIYDFKQRTVNEIIRSYFTYDFEQHLDRIKNLPVKDAKILTPVLRSIYDNWDNRANELFGTKDYNLFYDVKNKKQLIDLFFENELDNVINDTLKIVPDCSLLPQYIFNEVFDNTETLFSELKTPYKRFDFSLR